MVGESKFGTTTRWTDVGGELASLVLTSFRNIWNGDSFAGLAPGMLIDGWKLIWPLISWEDRRFVRSKE